MAIKTYQFNPVSIRYQNQQIAAMRWLASKGVTPEEIRLFRWRSVDEEKRVIVLERPVFSHIYDKEFNLVYQRREVRKILFSPIGSGTEQFWFKSKTPSFFWVFLKYYPNLKNWRAEQQIDYLWSTEEIEKFINDVNRLPPEITTNLLTMNKKFDTIEVSKMNFTNQNREHT